MNLWVKRIGQLTNMSVALFFLISCQEDVATLGYPNPNTKFKVFSYDIPLESSVLLRDSLRTSNLYYSGESNRLLVGQYQDDRFGTITANAITQYFTTSAAKLPSGAVYDSISLQLQFDLYHYGSAQKTSQSVSVYKLEEVLTFGKLSGLFNNTTVATGELLGSKSFTIDPDDFDDFATSATDYDTAITVKVRLSNSLGSEIFAAAERNRDNAKDTLYVYYPDFTAQFKGLVIKPDVADKVVGFSPGAANTRVLVHFHTATDTAALVLGMGNVVSFNQINGDRSATELAQIQQVNLDYLQDGETRYVESGIGILTKLDLTNFYHFLDTIPNIMVNSAELVIENVESGTYAPPSSLVLRNLTPSNNRFRKYSKTRPQDSVDVVRYRGFLTYDVASSQGAPVVDSDLAFYARGDQATSLAYSSSKKSYSGVFTLLLQQMTIRGDDRTPLDAFVLHPGTDSPTKPAFTSGAKSLHRAIFPKSGIKLRISYTKPLLNQ